MTICPGLKRQTRRSYHVYLCVVMERSYHVRSWTTEMGTSSHHAWKIALFQRSWICWICGHVFPKSWVKRENGKFRKSFIHRCCASKIAYSNPIAILLIWNRNPDARNSLSNGDFSRKFSMARKAVRKDCPPGPLSSSQTMKGESWTFPSKKQWECLPPAPEHSVPQADQLGTANHDDFAGQLCWRPPVLRRKPSKLRSNSIKNRALRICSWTRQNQYRRSYGGVKSICGHDGANA